MNRNNKRLWLWLLLLLLLVAVPVAGLWSLFHLSSDTRVLRNSLLSSLEDQGARWKEKVELHAGFITCSAARAGLSFAPLDPEVKPLLECLRGAELGLYTVRSGMQERDLSAVLRHADEAMAGRGWERLVGVIRDGQLVTIYVPRESPREDHVQACVAVLHRKQFVLVSAKTKLQPLLDYAFERPEWQEQRTKFAGLQ